MKIKTIAKHFVCISLLALNLGCRQGSSNHKIIAIIGVNVIDSSSGLKSNQTVIITDNKISSVGDRNTQSVPKSATQIDGSNKYLIPGLWDAHVHLSYEPELMPTMMDLLLVNGITSIRDTGGQLDLVLPLKEKADANPERYPRVKIAGPLLDGVPTVYDGVSRVELGLGANNPQEAQRLVDDFVSAGVDFIKSYEMLTPESFAAVIARAREHNKVVTGHVPLSMDVIEASALGLRSMEHMRNLEMSISEDHDSLLSVRKQLLVEGANKVGTELRSEIHNAQRIHAILTEDVQRRNQVLRALQENGTWQIPTLSINTPSAFRPFAKPSWREKFKYLPGSMEMRWNQLAERVLQRPVSDQSLVFPDWSMKMVNHLKEAGVPIMAGTDTPIFLLTPGFSLHNELSLLVKAGLSPLEALEAATSRPAEYFGLENLGLIKEGMLADLVLLNLNPLADIENTQSIQAVIRNGKLYDREALDLIMKELDSGKAK